MSGVSWPLFALCVALAPLVSTIVCRRFDLVKENFRGEKIVASSGIALIFLSVAGFVLNLTGPWRWEALVVGVGFGLLGVADDRFGSRAVGGFRGHVKSLLRGRPTTGAWKLLGGGAIAFWVAWRHDSFSPILLVDTLCVGLGANAINLLDLRPGRALFGFALLSLPSTMASIIAKNPVGLCLVPSVAGAMALWPSDSKARSMLGDTGSNALGAVAGFAAVVCLPPGARVVFAACVLFVNVITERVSINVWIETTPWARAVDQKLGVRAKK